MSQSALNEYIETIWHAESDDEIQCATYEAHGYVRGLLDGEKLSLDDSRQWHEKIDDTAEKRSFELENENE